MRAWKQISTLLALPFLNIPCLPVYSATAFIIPTHHISFWFSFSFSQSLLHELIDPSYCFLSFSLDLSEIIYIIDGRRCLVHMIHCSLVFFFLILKKGMSETSSYTNLILYQIRPLSNGAMSPFCFPFPFLTHCFIPTFSFFLFCFSFSDPEPPFIFLAFCPSPKKRIVFLNLRTKIKSLNSFFTSFDLHVSMISLSFFPLVSGYLILLDCNGLCVFLFVFSFLGLNLAVLFFLSFPYLPLLE